MDPPSPPARINSNRSSPVRTSTVDVSQPEARSSQSSLWLDRSLHLPSDFHSTRASGSRLASVAMVSQSAAAEELTRATMDLESSRNSHRRMTERPSMRLASMAQTFNVDNDNYKRKYQELLAEKISSEEAHTKTKDELADMQREVDTLTSSLTTERRNSDKWISQHRDLSKKFAEIEMTASRVTVLEDENETLKVTIDANLRTHTKELMDAREEARHNINDLVAQETTELRKAVADRTQQVADFRRALEQARDDIDRLEASNESFEQNIRAMDRVHAAAIKVCEEDAEERISKANQKARQWEDDMVEQGMRIRTAQQELSTANSALTQFKQEAARIRNDFEDYRTEVSRDHAETDRRHASEMSHMRSQVDDATEQLSHCKSELLKKDDQLHQLHTEQKRIRSSLNDATEDAAFLRAECDTAKRATEDAYSKLHELQVAHDNLTEDHEAICEKLIQRMEDQSHSEGASGAVAKLDRITKEYDAARAQWREQRASLVDAENDARDKNAKLELEIANLEASLRSANRPGASDSAASVRQLRKDLADATANNMSLMRQLDDSKEKCFQLRRDMSKYQCQISELESSSQQGLMTHTPEAEEPAPRRVRGEKATRGALETIVPFTNNNSITSARSRYDAATKGPLSKDSILASIKPTTTKKAVFAITGIPASVQLAEDLSSFPHSEVCSAPSDAPIPAEVTHIISNGNITVKVLTALVRGCWVLPPTYVAKCSSNGGLVSEEQYGFRHADLPLAGKVIGITAGFRQGQFGKHLQDIAQEGGATIKFINMTTDDAAEISQYSIVACLKAEQQSFPKNGKTWESIVLAILPTAIQASLKKEYNAYSDSVMAGGQNKNANMAAMTASTIPFRSAPSSMTPAY